MDMLSSTKKDTQSQVSSIFSFGTPKDVKQYSVLLRKQKIVSNHYSKVTVPRHSRQNRKRVMTQRDYY